jgi:hypothetical protein
MARLWIQRKSKLHNISEENLNFKVKYRIGILGCDIERLCFRGAASEQPRANTCVVHHAVSSDPTAAPSTNQPQSPSPEAAENLHSDNPICVHSIHLFPKHSHPQPFPATQTLGHWPAYELPALALMYPTSLCLLVKFSPKTVKIRL